VDDRAALAAIFFRLRTGCQWNALNESGICSSSNAHRRFQEWNEAGVFEQLWAHGLIKYDELKDIQWEWQAMDGAMVKAPLDGPATGPDRGNRGTKRSLLTAGADIPVGLVIAGANRVDFKLVEETIVSIPIARSVESSEEALENLCLDAGYDYDEVRFLGEVFGYTLHLVPRDKEARELKQQAGKKARRWVVERGHSWFNRFRALLVRWEKKAENYLGELHLACAFITYRAAAYWDRL
jgi:transposase